MKEDLGRVFLQESRENFLAFSFIELSFIALTYSVSSSLYTVGITGAYSHFKRLRLEPPSAQILSTQRRSVPVNFRIFVFPRENDRICTNFPNRDCK